MNPGRVASLPIIAPARKSVVVKRPVARALFEELPVDSDPAPEEIMSVDSADSVPADISSSPVVFSVQKQTAERKQRGRKKVPAPIVDTPLRRCTRSAAKLDGFKHVVFEQLSLQPTKKRPRSKPMDDEAQPISAGLPGQDKQPNAPPHTPIHVLQAGGAELEIDPSLLSTDKLMVDPKEDSSSSSA